MSEWIPIEAAADLVGRSPATLRRWAADGSIKAEKRGKSWLVWTPSLSPEPPRTGPIQTISDVPWDAAWDHLKDLDLRSPWVPDILGYRDYIADWRGVQAAAAARLEAAGPFERAIPVEI